MSEDMVLIQERETCSSSFSWVKEASVALKLNGKCLGENAPEVKDIESAFEEFEKDTEKTYSLGALFRDLSSDENVRTKEKLLAVWGKMEAQLAR
ncbi:hypothetical protein MMC28_007430 [Mycoblastus sanguinarius]|nr:hypothetical protein [Mycoblastus sanguinarius]